MDSKLTLGEIVAFMLCILGMAGVDGSPVIATVMIIVGGCMMKREFKKEGMR